MRFISRMLHGLADYAVGLIVMVLPFYFGWTGPERAAFVALGAFVILYSLLTDYEMGLIRLLRIRVHLLLDALFGIVLLAMPTLFEIYAGALSVYVIGALALPFAATTKTRAHGTRSEATIWE
jgi:hypothetical protein